MMYSTVKWRFTYACHAITIKTPDAATHITSHSVWTQCVLVTRIFSIFTFVNVWKNENSSDMDEITEVIIKFTISWIVIGLKNSYFPLIHLPSCSPTVKFKFSLSLIMLCHGNVCSIEIKLPKKVKK